MKIIHVQLHNINFEYLPDKRSIVGVPEVDRENILSKLFDLLDNKTFTIFSPTNNVTIFDILSKRSLYLENLVCFEQERRDAF